MGYRTWTTGDSTATDGLQKATSRLRPDNALPSIPAAAPVWLLAAVAVPAPQGKITVEPLGE